MLEEYFGQILFDKEIESFLSFFLWEAVFHHHHCVLSILPLVLSRLSGFTVSISIYKDLTIVLQPFYNKKKYWICVHCWQQWWRWWCLWCRTIGPRVELNPLSLGAISPRDRQLPSLLSFFLSPLVILSWPLWWRWWWWGSYWILFGLDAATSNDINSQHVPRERNKSPELQKTWCWGIALDQVFLNFQHISIITCHLLKIQDLHSNW